MKSSPTAAPLLLLLATVVVGALGADWGYEHQHGPGEWGGICKEGLFQSPIDLKPAVAHPRHFERLAFVGYERPANATITNNGHTLVINLQGGCDAHLAAGGLPSFYVLAQIHFHWGSEHTLNGNRFPLEAHFVHYDRSRYQTLGDAVGRNDGLAVLGVFYEEGDEEDENFALEKLLKPLDEAKVPGGVGTVGVFRPEQLLPLDTDSFFRYRGSLTTPGCDEGVVWTVLEEPAPVSKKQVEQLQSLQTKSGAMMLNYRPVRPLNGRNLYMRSLQGSSGSTIGATAALLLTALLLDAAA